jgi:2-methylcitrate dehydratase PrpD
VRCVEDERCSASFPHAFPAVLRVTTRTGEELEARVEVNRGGPGNPLSDEELARKFHDNAVRSLPESARPSSRPERSPFLTLRASRISPRC